MANRIDPVADPFIDKILSEEIGTRHPRRLESNRMISATEIQHRTVAKVALSVLGQVIPNATPTKVIWDTRIFDPDGIWNLTTRLTVPGMVGGGSKTTGLWFIHSNITWQGTVAATKHSVRIFKNNALFAEFTEYPAVADPWTEAVQSFNLDPVPGDYYEVQVEQATGGAEGILGTALAPFDQFSYFELVHIW